MNTLKGHKKVTPPKLQKFQNGIKTGRNIALIGVFCPFLWYSILTRQSADLTLLHAIHSGIIVGLGLLVLLINYLALFIHKRKKENI